MRGIESYGADLSAYYPHGEVCEWLKRDVSSGHQLPEGPVIMGTCRLYGGEVYDQSCAGCAGYRGRRR